VECAGRVVSKLDMTPLGGVRWILRSTESSKRPLVVGVFLFGWFSVETLAAVRFRRFAP
jgi:hypothetical protein